MRFLFSGSTLIYLALLLGAWLAFGTGGIVAAVVIMLLLSLP